MLIVEYKPHSTLHCASEYELDRIVSLTDCLKPCHYTAYSLVGETLTGRKNYTSVLIQRAKSTDTVRREILGIAIKTFIFSPKL